MIYSIVWNITIGKYLIKHWYYYIPTTIARKLWRDYFASGVDGVVFIVDAVDRARFPEAKKELDVNEFICYLLFIHILYIYPHITIFVY